MWPGTVIVEEIIFQNSPEMLFGKYNHMVKRMMKQ